MRNGYSRLDLSRRQHFGIGAVQDHRIAAPDKGIALRIGMDQVQDAALADHRVVVEVLLQPFPELQREFVERFIAIQQIVGADDRGVAADIAATDPALFEHGDALLPEFLGQIVGGRQPMPAAANDDDVIVGLWFGITPGRLPALVAGQRLFDDLETGIPHESRSPFAHPIEY